MIKIINEVNFDKWEKEHDFGANEDWVVSVPKECIKGATLLSKEEYKKYRNNIPKINERWWLCSPSYDSSVVCVVSIYGYIRCGYITNDLDYGIRPALQVNLQSSILGVGDKFEFGRHTFTIISKDLAICDDIIGKGCFRKDWKSKDSNVYEKSDVKKVVDNWFNKAYNEYQEE